MWLSQEEINLLFKNQVSPYAMSRLPVEMGENRNTEIDIDVDYISIKVDNETEETNIFQRI